MKVTQTIQSPGNEPVEFPLYNGSDPMGVVSAVTSAMALRTKMEDPSTGCPIPVHTLAIHIEF